MESHDLCREGENLYGAPLECMGMLPTNKQIFENLKKMVVSLIICKKLLVDDERIHFRYFSFL